MDLEDARREALRVVACAWELLEREGWVKGAWAWDDEGYEVQWWEQDAHNFCLLGAVTRCAFPQAVGVEGEFHVLVGRAAAIFLPIFPDLADLSYQLWGQRIVDENDSEEDTAGVLELLRELEEALPSASEEHLVLIHNHLRIGRGEMDEEMERVDAR